MDSRLWHPNEQLLLRAAVRFKKHEGTLFVTPQRVAWQQQGSSQLTPSIYYNDIQGKFKLLLSAKMISSLFSNQVVFDNSIGTDS